MFCGAPGEAMTGEQFWKDWAWTSLKTNLAVTDEVKAVAFQFAEAYAAHVTQARWISVEERLPELADEYLVVERGDRHSSTADWIGGIWKTVRSFGQDCEERELYNVSHWQYLPETPEAPAAEPQKEK